jgi:hypothetical protein
MKAAMGRLSEKLKYGSLGALLVLALIAAAVPDEQRDDEGMARAVSRPQAPAAVAADAAQPPRIALDRLRREAPAGPARDLFTSKSWYIAPPPPPPVEIAPAPPPPPPSAPPLPFSYMGRLLEDASQHPVYFLVKGDKLYTVAEGELIDGTYRLDGIDSGQLALTYLPLNIRQFLPLGSGS